MDFKPQFFLSDINATDAIASEVVVGVPDRNRIADRKALSASYFFVEANVLPLPTHQATNRSHRPEKGATHDLVNRIGLIVEFETAGETGMNVTAEEEDVPDPVVHNMIKNL